MNKTGIEYLTHTWNPIIMRCSKISEACENCWHLRLCTRLSKNPKIHPHDQAIYSGEADQVVRMEELSAPKRLKRPARIGVQFMGDLFHESTPYAHIDSVFEAMALAPQHTFLVLTKRPRSAWDWFKSRPQGSRMTLPNVWLGVTVENQTRADQRIPVLMQIPAAVRFVSIEPMLSEIDLRIVPCRACNHPGDVLQWPCPYCKGRRFEWPDWVICGGETGPGARPTHPDWVRTLRDQCQEAGAPFLFKQWGEYVESVPSDEESANHHLVML